MDIMNVWAIPSGSRRTLSSFGLEAISEVIATGGIKLITTRKGKFSIYCSTCLAPLVLPVHSIVRLARRMGPHSAILGDMGSANRTNIPRRKVLAKTFFSASDDQSSIEKVAGQKVSQASSIIVAIKKSGYSLPTTIKARLHHAVHQSDHTVDTADDQSSECARVSPIEHGYSATTAAVVMDQGFDSETDGGVFDVKNREGEAGRGLVKGECTSIVGSH